VFEKDWRRSPGERDDSQACATESRDREHRCRACAQALPTLSPIAEFGVSSGMPAPSPNEWPARAPRAIGKGRAPEASTPGYPENGHLSSTPTPPPSSLTPFQATSGFNCLTASARIHRQCLEFWYAPPRLCAYGRGARPPACDRRGRGSDHVPSGREHRRGARRL
jgi:hypothetical protein